jgi:hypothetical protein
VEVWEFASAVLVHFMDVVFSEKASFICNRLGYSLGSR